ncbi:unnamed protein product [Boreogadus saida]
MGEANDSEDRSKEGSAVISSESTTPRSFVIRTQHGAELRRNRRHLQPGPVPQPIPAAHRDVTGTDTHSDGATMSETVPCPWFPGHSFIRSRGTAGVAGDAGVVAVYKVMVPGPQGAAAGARQET